MRGRPEVEMVEAFSEHERHLEAALAAARAPGATPEVCQNACPVLCLQAACIADGCSTHHSEVFAHSHHWEQGAIVGPQLHPWRGTDVRHAACSCQCQPRLGCIAGGFVTHGSCRGLSPVQPSAMTSAGFRGRRRCAWRRCGGAWARCSRRCRATCSRPSSACPRAPRCCTRPPPRPRCPGRCSCSAAARAHPWVCLLDGGYRAALLDPERPKPCFGSLRGSPTGRTAVVCLAPGSYSAVAGACRRGSLALKSCAAAAPVAWGLFFSAHLRARPVPRLAAFWGLLVCMAPLTTVCCLFLSSISLILCQPFYCGAARPPRWRLLARLSSLMRHN